VNLLIALLAIHTPQYVKKRALADLFRFTAAAFESDVPPMAGLVSDECLLQYALFTQDHTERLVRDGHDVEYVQHRLYQSAYELGEMQRARFRIRTVKDVMAMGRVLYRIPGRHARGNRHQSLLFQSLLFQSELPDHVGDGSRPVCRDVEWRAAVFFRENHRGTTALSSPFCPIGRTQYETRDRGG
jgi:hypothetical protein